MSKNNGNGKTLQNGIILQQQEDIKEILQGIITLKESVSQIGEKLDCHLREHKEKPEAMLLPLIGKIGKRRWTAIFVGFFLFQIVLAVLIFKFGIEKFIGIFK